jgi:hypothetical protein
VIVRMPDALANLTQAKVSVNVRGQTSNAAVIQLAP